MAAALPGADAKSEAAQQQRKNQAEQRESNQKLDQGKALAGGILRRSRPSRFHRRAHCWLARRRLVRVSARCWAHDTGTVVSLGVTATAPSPPDLPTSYRRSRAVHAMPSAKLPEYCPSASGSWAPSRSISERACITAVA